MTVALVPLLGQGALAVGTGVGVDFLARWLAGNPQKPSKPKDIRSVKLSELGSNATIGDMLRVQPLFRDVANGTIRDTQDLEARAARLGEGLRQQRSSFDSKILEQGANYALGLRKDEAKAALARTIADRQDRVASTIDLDKARYGLEEGARGSNFGRTMAILDQSGGRFDSALDKLISAGSADQDKQMAFTREMYDRERAARNSPLAMIERITGAALPVFALLG